MKKTERDFDKNYEQMTAAEKDFEKMHEHIFDYMFNVVKMSDEEVKNVIEQMARRFYFLFGQTVNAAMKNPNLNVLVKNHKKLPFGKYFVSDVLLSMFCDIMFCE